MAVSRIPLCHLTVCCLCSKLFGRDEKMKTCCALTYCGNCYPKHKENKSPGHIICQEELPDNIIETHKPVTNILCMHCHFPLSFLVDIPYCLKCEIGAIYKAGIPLIFLKICSICCKLQNHEVLKPNGRKDYLSCCGLYFCKRCIPKHEAKHPKYLSCCPAPDPSNKMFRQQCRECKNIVHLKCGSIIKTTEDHNSETYHIDIRNVDFFNSKFVCNKCIFLSGIKIECENSLWSDPTELLAMIRTNRPIKCNREIELFQAPKCRSCNISICLEHINTCHDCNNTFCSFCSEKHKCQRCHQCHFNIDNIQCDFCNMATHCEKLYYYFEANTIDSPLIQRNICCKCKDYEAEDNAINQGRCNECKIDFRVPDGHYCDCCNKLIHLENKIDLGQTCSICEDNLAIPVKSRICCDCMKQVSNQIRILKPILTIFPDGIISIISELVSKPINNWHFTRCVNCQKYTCLRHLKGPEKSICIHCRDNEEIDYDISSLSLD
ncbi:MAG: hypothetical protein Hyperionvirus4_115 [Hyperionvirus sp.]|uniref:Uncharacterized protein n=1 Tax=Hyperionvirus sp. TaxID=2487770 RepID=A0A3G5A7A9_9VIRU|nr:MAG: hypothetical protein Hyperionvirus4_115 [Hyperionvirus sp.]